MSDSIFKLFGAAVLCVMVIIILRRESPDTALTAKMCAGVVLASVCVFSMSPIIEYVDELSEGIGTGEALGESAEILLKALGVSVLTHITATVCRDSGEGSIAYYVEMGGKIEIMLISLPLLRRILDLALELLEMS